MHEIQIRRARVVSSVAATLIALACGTNYVYSAWAPQFADRLRLTTTESNVIGLAGNLGMYALGVPVGIFVDHKGPRPAVLGGMLLFAIGYWPFRASYDLGSGSVPVLCFFAFFVGLGGCMAFSAAIKTSALNWPHHRGTATAFPLAAFGLSAFFFSVLGSVFFPGSTGDFLTLLAVGTPCMCLVGFFFLRVLPPTSSYHVVIGSETATLKRTPSNEAKARYMVEEPGVAAESPAEPEPESSSSGCTSIRANADGPDNVDVEAALSIRRDRDEDSIHADEFSSLISHTSSLSGVVLVQSSSVDMDRSRRVDIRGWHLLSNLEFWQLFAIMGILAGIGLMTINNIGHNVQALWKSWDDSISDEFLIHMQALHVSILSVGSFLGRLLSGVGSDFLVKSLRASRVWCLVLASLVFCIAQVCALSVQNPHFLGLVSALSGLGYGFLFGVFPSIVAETFGIHGLSQNWGFMMLSPVVSSNIFNLFYGAVFDSHSVVGPGGGRSCPDGLDCYWSAYLVTLAACGLGLVVTLWAIRHQYMEWPREKGKASAVD